MNPISHAKKLCDAAIPCFPAKLSYIPRSILILQHLQWLFSGPDTPTDMPHENCWIYLQGIANRIKFKVVDQA
jgi:hypothetical protein